MNGAIPGAPPGAPLGLYLVPLIAVGIVVLRNARPRRLRVERLWVSPLVVAALCGLALTQSPPGTIGGVVIDAVALALGAALGWWRGRASRFTVDPVTHAVTSKVSPLGMLLILAIFAVRYGLRSALSTEASALHVTAADLTDGFLMLAIGLVFAQRLEWWIRARRMIGEAQAQRGSYFGGDPAG